MISNPAPTWLQYEDLLMDKKIKKVLSKEKSAVKETKELLKMDKKNDRKLTACGMKKKMK